MATHQNTVNPKNLNHKPCLVYLYQISYLLVKANSLNRSRRRINHRLADRPKAHPTVHTLPRNDGQSLHLTAMFHPATPEFEGSFVEWHDLVVSRPKQIRAILTIHKAELSRNTAAIKSSSWRKSWAIIEQICIHAFSLRVNILNCLTR